MFSGRENFPPYKAILRNYFGGKQYRSHFFNNYPNNLNNDRISVQGKDKYFLLGNSYRNKRVSRLYLRRGIFALTTLRFKMQFQTMDTVQTVEQHTNGRSTGFFKIFCLKVSERVFSTGVM